MKKSLNRITAYAGRVVLEIVRDPISYIFALGFPLVMLVIMTVVNASIPAEAQMTLFEPASLVPGISVFGLTFMALFTAILVSSDRSDGFLVRAALSPMSRFELAAGYIAPVIGLSVVQCVIAYTAGMAVQGSLVIIESLYAIAVSLPTIVFFAEFGLIVGFVFSQKGAPAVSSIVISAASMLGGIWMDNDSLGGAWLDICRALPFYHSVKAARLAYSGETDGLLFPLAVSAAYALILVPVTAAVISKKRMESR